MLLRLLLLVGWAVVLAKTYFLVRGMPTPTPIEYANVAALPFVLWYLKLGLDLLGAWFYMLVLSYVGAGVVFWMVRSWRRFFLEEPRTLSVPWLIVSTILAVNFLILIFFMARELIVSHIRKPLPELKFEEPPTHPARPPEPN